MPASQTLTPRTVAFILGMALWTLCGCDLLPTHDKVKNPVVGPPPRRTSWEDRSSAGTDSREDESATAGTVRLGDASRKYASDFVRQGEKEAQEASSSGPGWHKPAGIAQVGYTTSEAATGPASSPEQLKTASSQDKLVADSEVAAVVDGDPILCSEVLEPFSAGLAKAAKEAKPAEYKQLRRMLIQKHLQPYIERQLLIHALRTKLKDEQWQGVEAQLEKMFNEEVQKMCKQHKVGSAAELDVEMQKQHTSLAAIKQSFRNNKLAQQYMAFRTGVKEGTDRPDLLAYYQEHVADFEFPAQFKWQQIVLTSAKHGGTQQTERLANQLLDELEQGVDFDALAKKHSSGPTAAKGGHWDWTRQGSLADTELEDLLLKLPPGNIAGPHPTKTGFEIVRLVERKDGGRKSFASVQDEIRMTIREKKFREAADSLLKELKEGAVIETMFDQDQAATASASR